MPYSMNGATMRRSEPAARIVAGLLKHGTNEHASHRAALRLVMPPARQLSVDRTLQRFSKLCAEPRASARADFPLIEAFALLKTRYTKTGNALESASRIEQDADRSGVDRANVHHSLEYTARHADTRPA